MEEAVAARDAATGAEDRWIFPLFAPDAQGNLTGDNRTARSGFWIPGDTVRFGYDALGRLASARNRDAWISRRWNPDGTLAADTLRIRTYAGRDSTTHVYGLRYAYDLSGRRTAMHHPRPLRINPYDPDWTVDYTYDPVTGQLETVGDAYNGFTFHYDAEGRPWKTAGQTFVYDAEGRLERRMEGVPGVATATYHDDWMDYDDRGKLTKIRTLGDSTVNAYSGLGALTRSFRDDRFRTTDPDERHLADAMGNVYWTRTHHVGGSDLSDEDWRRFRFEKRTGRMTVSGEGTSPTSTNILFPGYTEYDAAGNRAWYGTLAPGPASDSYAGGAALVEKTRSYYDAEGRLRVVDRRTCVYSPATALACNPAPAESRATFEEYRYDPLGRRILTRTSQDWYCATNCVSGLTRTVWDGDRVLHEIRAPSAAMERDSGWSHGIPAAKHYGRVSYLFGGALDHPLALYRLYHDTLFVSPGYEGLPGSPVAVIPRTNWRGDYDMGFFAGKGPTHKLADGKPSWCVTVPLEEYDHEPVEEENEEIMPTTSICAEIDWPAEHLWMTHRARPGGPAGSYSWWGSLIHNKRDLTGQLYMRNRYYDPAAGRFTQEDPIGLAGGINLYGFAAGDPVNLSDPYGLNPIGKIIKLGVRGFKTLVRDVPEEALVRAVREGEDVIVPSRQAARRIAREAGDGKPPVHDRAHRAAGEGARNHYHPNGREGGHVFYSTASALTVSHHVSENAPGVVKAGAAVIDFFNPLSLPKDAIDIYRDVRSIFEEKN